MRQRWSDPQEGLDDSQGTLSLSLLEAMLQDPRRPVSSRPVPGLIIGWIEAIEESGLIRVSAPNLGDGCIASRCLCPIGPEQIGAQCAIMFEQGDVERPVIMGLLQHTVLPITTAGASSISQDAETFQITAAREIVLHCGKASLRLTQDGRIELRGTTLVSHASGLNRIRGGSIKLN
jgi:hypothetical protein